MKKFVLMVLTGLSFHSVAFADCIPFSDTSQPINTGGEYCLSKDLFVAKNGVQIFADNVTFDLGGHVIHNSSIPYQSQGIWAQGKNITVRNGTVIGFDVGVAIFNRSAEGTTLVENMVVSSGRMNQKKASLSGILVLGPNLTVKNNIVTSLIGAYVHAIEAWGGNSVSGGSISISNNRISQIRSLVAASDPQFPNANALSSATGIFVREAVQSKIQDNMISDIWPGPGGVATGIDYESASVDNGNSTIYKNQIYNLFLHAKSIAIFAVAKQSTASPLRIGNNDINKFETGINVYASTANQQPSVTLNVVRNAKTPYVGGNQVNNQ